MKRSPNQHGFSFLILLVIIVVVAGLAFTGWYVWSKNRQDKNIDQTNKTSQTNQNKDEKQNKPTDFSEGSKYLVIKEWGVKIPLSSSIAEAYYEFESDGMIDYVALYDAAFDRLKNANNIPCGGRNTFQFYSISRAKPENLAAPGESAGPSYQEFPFSKGYLFGGLGAHQAPPPCGNLNPDPYGGGQDDKNILDIANDKERAFDSAFKDLQKVE